jgi:hypothetical protein
MMPLNGHQSGVAQALLIEFAFLCGLEDSSGDRLSDSDWLCDVADKGTRSLKCRPEYSDGLWIECAGEVEVSI